MCDCSFIHDFYLHMWTRTPVIITVAFVCLFTSICSHAAHILSTQRIVCKLYLEVTKKDWVFLFIFIHKIIINWKHLGLRNITTNKSQVFLFTISGKFSFLNLGSWLLPMVAQFFVLVCSCFYKPLKLPWLCHSRTETYPEATPVSSWLYASGYCCAAGLSITLVSGDMHSGAQGPLYLGTFMLPPVFTSLPPHVALKCFFSFQSSFHLATL